MNKFLPSLAILSFNTLASTVCYTDTIGNTHCRDEGGVVKAIPSSRSNPIDNSHTLSIQSPSITHTTDNVGVTRDSDGNKWKTDTIGNTRGVDNSGKVTTCYRDTIGVLRCK